MIDRFFAWVERFIIACDKFVAVWLRGWGFVWFNWGELPSTDESISGWVGRSAIAGEKWALVAEKVIDAIMLAPGHCREAVQHDKAD